MISMLSLIASLISSYLIGSLPTSYVFTRALKGIDIREIGSRNAGATNVLRSVGKVPALLTLVIDALKGLIVVTLIVNFFYQFEEYLDYDFYRALMGLLAICGHIWPIFLKFRGGKGVATTLGVALGIAPVILIPSFLIWCAVFFLTNYVSLASIISLVSFPIIASVFNYPIYTVVLSVVICLVVVYKHKENIKRLLKGQENKTRLF